MTHTGLVRLRTIQRLLITLLVGVIASTIGAAATVIGAAATTSVGVAFAIGIVTVVGSNLIISGVARLRIRHRSRKPTIVTTGASTTGSRGFSFLALAVALALSGSWALPRPATPKTVPTDSTTIALSDGTRLVASITRPDGPTAAPPAIFVHGGPGISDMGNDVSALRPLARDRTLVVYDQIGAGASSRLPNPADYTLARSVADLEAMRDSIGADRVVLIGHSWGARIVTAYLAIHPEHVASVVLTAPGSPSISTQPLPKSDPATRLTTVGKAGLYLSALKPRTLFTYAMGSLAPAVAPEIVGDNEADHLFAGLYRRETPALFCDPTKADLAGVDGVGYYSWLGSQEQGTDPRVSRRALAAVSVPVLIIDPKCDYIPKAIAREYLALLPDATIEEVPGGHLAYSENPAAWDRIVRAFLRESE